MAKKKDASTGSSDASFLRRSGRETTSRKQTSSPVHSRKSERLEKHTSPNISPVKNRLETVEKQTGSSTLRRSDRGKKMVETTELPKTKSTTKEKTSNNSKQSSEEVNEDNETEKQDPDVGSRKRKKFDAILYKAIFKAQRTRIESDVDKEPKSQNSINVQGTPDKENKAFLEGRVIDLDQIEHGDCPETKSPDGKSIESGDVEKKNGGNVSPSNGNIANSDNHVLQTSSHRIEVEHDLENHQELDTCHKVTETHKAAAIMENAENNDVYSNMQNSKFVEFWVPVKISNVQLEQYCATLLSNATALRSNSKSDILEALNNVFSTNRKICNHPYTVNPELENSLMKDKDRSTIVDVGKEVSGKFQFLDRILPEIQKLKLRVLILFQPAIGVSDGFLPLGHTLVEFIHQRFGENSYEHVDVLPNMSSKKQIKQAAINMFNKDMTRFIFLKESRACHHGIKLSSVDAIIIFDSDVNPSNDLKSLQKLSIDSQLDQIMIFRLYCSSTLEEKMLKLAENNVAVDISSHNLRSNYDSLLMWGASDLFDRLTKFHSQTGLNILSEGSFLKDVVEEFLYILSHKCKSNDTSLKLISTRILNRGIYGKNTALHSEVKTRLPVGDPPYIFWRNLLDGRSPVWKFVSEATPRQRKRRFILDSLPMEKSGVDGGGGVKTRRKTVNINSTVEPARLKTVTEGETGGVNEVVVAAKDESQSSSGDRYWSTSVNHETSVLDSMKPAVAQLCNIFKFSEDVKDIVDEFLEFVINNDQVRLVSKKHTSTLHGLMISLCWMGSSIAKNKIDRSESFGLAKKHLNFSCDEEQAELVFEKLKPVKKTFLERKQTLPGSKDSVTTPEGVKDGIEKSQHTTNVDASNETVSRKCRYTFEKINREWDERRVILEYGYNLDKALYQALYSNPLTRSEKLEKLEREFANKLKEHERLVHTKKPEVAPTLPEKPVEAECHDEPVCEGANDIESTSSHTSEKEVVDAAVSSERIEEVPAQQLGDDVEADVAEKVISSPDVSRAVEDHNETNANDVAPRVNCVDAEMPAGSYNKENDNENDEIDRNETGANDMAPHVDSGDMEMLAGSCTKKNGEDGIGSLDTSHVVEDCHETVDDVAPAAEMGTPAGTCDKEDAEDGEILPDTPDDGDNHNEISSNDVLPRAESADVATPAGNEDNAEDSIIRPDALKDKTPSVQLVSSPASDHEIQNDPLQVEQIQDGVVQDEEIDVGNLQPGAGQLDQIIPNDEPGVPSSTDPTVADTPSDMLPQSGPLLEQIPDSGVQDEEINVANLQQPGASQLDQIILDDEPDLMVADNPSDTVPQTGPLLEPICEEPTITVPQSGEHLEENPVSVPATEAEQQPGLVATSVAPAPLVNALNMFDNMANRVIPQLTNQTDPLQAEVDRLYIVKENVAKFHQDVKQRLNADCEKEIAEVVAQICLKYEAKQQQADAAYKSKNTELETNINRVSMNKILAEAFRSKCQDPGMQAPQAEIMQHLHRFSVSNSMRHYHGASSSSSPGQSSGNQPPPPVQQSQPPLQMVHQPAALFSSMLSRPPSTTPSRPPPPPPPPVVNQLTSSTPPTTTRLPPIVNQVTPTSTTPTTTRPPPGFNMNGPTSLHNGPHSIPQRDMSAANIRISTETRGQSSHICPPVISETRAPTATTHIRPLVINETRAPPTHLRPLVINETRAPAPHLRPLVINETRAPAPHLRPLVINETRAPAPHLRPLFIGEARAPAPHLRSMASTEIRARAPHMQPFRPTCSVSPDVVTHRRVPPSQHVTGGPSYSPVMPPVSTSSSQPPPASEPYTVPSDHDMVDITDLIGEDTARPSSAHELVCLSDDDD